MQPELIEEAKARMEKHALAQSIIKDNEDWFNSHADELPEIEAHGMWAGRRQTKTEEYKPDIFAKAILAIMETYEFPLAIVLNVISEKRKDQLRKAGIHILPDDDPLLVVLKLLSNSERKQLALHKELWEMRENKAVTWGQLIRQALAEFDLDEAGVHLVYGNVNVTPITKRPSEDKNVILEPGEEAKI